VVIVTAGGPLRIYSSHSSNLKEYVFLKCDSTPDGHASLTLLLSCLYMCQVHLVTCVLLHRTKFTVNFCLPAERPHCKVILCEIHTGGIEVINNIRLLVTV